jgi:YbbR domain-containing protein
LIKIFLQIVWNLINTLYFYISNNNNNNQNTKTMTTLTNTTGSKEVQIRRNGEKSVIAMYCQVYQGESQVLQSKSFANVKNAEKWAKQVLN